MDDLRGRYLIAISKLLGESPLEPGGDLGVALSGKVPCEPWQIEENLQQVFGEKNDRFLLTHEVFAQLLLNCRRPLPTDHFFAHFFGSSNTLEKFESAVDEYRKIAMWGFGNFKFAYKRLATSDFSEFTHLIRRASPRDAAHYLTRLPFDEIEDVPKDDLIFLGYVSGPEVDDLDFCLQSIEQITADERTASDKLKQVGEQTLGKIRCLLGKRSLYFPSDMKLDLKALLDTKERLKELVPSLRGRRDKARDVAIRNTKRYLNLPHLDVYVATSMRTDNDYRLQHEFVQNVFSHQNVADLKLRFFDPTISFDPNRIAKGLIECLMLHRAKVTVYHAGAEDTMGKDSELAATLAQGKPVIVFVPSDPPSQEVNVPNAKCPKCGEIDGLKRRVDMDRRAGILKADHPLGLQLDLRTGVAHGIIVVRTVDQCTRMLRKVLLNQLEFTIEHEGGMYRLVEKETGSIVRVISDDPYLTHAFWTYFRHSTGETELEPVKNSAAAV